MRSSRNGLHRELFDFHQFLDKRPMKGRKPIPTQIKILAGTARGDRINESEPKPDPALPECPSHLSDEARAEFDRLAPQLFRLRVLTDLDTAALAAYAATFSRWAEAERNVQEGGAVVRTPAGCAQVSPWLSVANEALRQMRAYSVELGLTPSSRSRIHVSPEIDLAGSKWEGLLA